MTRHASGEPTGTRDQIFAVPAKRIADFDFGGKTAAVFDDMLGRSVPFYAEMQRMIGELASDYAAEGTSIYDLGCSTGTTILKIAENIPRERNVRYVGVDYSPEMLEIAQRKLTESGFDRPFDLECGDLNSGVRIDNASVVLLVLTLQFIRPLYRQRLIKSIYDGMTEKGALILVEKVLGENSEFNRLFIHHYYEMKRENGYSDLEIAQKREALENILVPYRLEENKELLREQGFRHVDVFFKWYNFCAIIATK
ncbi:MAG: carboxy-S-adenosyl-L-methionine synthase CmoA [Candidatus Eisenbacteria bacterium]